MKDFKPQGMPEGEGKTLAQQCWDEIIFRIEEIEGRVIRDAMVAKDTCVQRNFNIARGYTDTVEYKGKRILKFIVTDGQLTSVQKL